MPKRTRSSAGESASKRAKTSDPVAIPVKVKGGTAKGKGKGKDKGNDYDVVSAVSPVVSASLSASSGPRLHVYVQERDVPEYPFVNHPFLVHTYLMRGKDELISKVQVPLKFRLLYEDDHTVVESLDSAVSGESTLPMLQVYRCHPDTKAVLKDKAKARKLVIGATGQGLFQVIIGEVSMRRGNRKFCLEITHDPVSAADMRFLPSRLVSSRLVSSPLVFSVLPSRSLTLRSSRRSRSATTSQSRRQTAMTSSASFLSSRALWKSCATG